MPKTRITVLAVPAALALLIPALLTRAPAEEQAKPPAAQVEPAPDQARPAALPKPLVIPEAERNRKNPVPVVPESIEAGRLTFSSQCAMCHGPGGDGKGDLAISLKLKVPDFRNPALQRKRTDGDLFFIITTGHGQMPSETRLLPQNKWEMINFIRSVVRSERPKS